MHGCGWGVRRIRRDTVNERAVRILLECILVYIVSTFSTSDIQWLFKGYPARIGYAIRGADGQLHLHDNEHSGHWSIDANKLNAYRWASVQRSTFLEDFTLFGIF